MDYIGKYLSDKGMDLAEISLTTYKGSLLQFQKWFEEANGEKLDPNNITPVDVKEYRGYLVRLGRKPKTIAKLLTAVKTFCEWAVDKEYIDYNPAKGIKGVTQQKEAPRWLERKEQLALTRALQKENNLRDTAIIYLMWHAGLRVSEVIDLEIRDIEISEKKGFVTVRDGKGGKYRTVPLNKNVRHALEAYLADCKITDGYLFISKQGRQLTVRGVQHMVEKYGKLAKLDKLTPHMFRHTFGHDLMRKPEVAPDMVAILMGHMTREGHPNVKTTYQYTVPSVKELEKAVKELEWED